MEALEEPCLHEKSSGAGSQHAGSTDSCMLQRKCNHVWGKPLGHYHARRGREGDDSWWSATAHDVPSVDQQLDGWKRVCCDMLDDALKAVANPPNMG